MDHELSADEFKAIRQRLGLSQAALAAQLGLGDNGARTIQRIEKGAPITGPMALAMRKLDDDALTRPSGSADKAAGDAG